jgi:LysM repeat protein
MATPSKTSSSPGYRLCPTCGTRVGAAATKCLVCGSDLGKVSGKTGPAAPVARPGAGTALGRRPLSLTTVLIILGVLILLAVGGGLIFASTEQGQQIINPPTSTATPTDTPLPTLTFTPTPTETSEPTATPLPPLDYRVQAGDTCIKIALNNNVSVLSIIEANLGVINRECTNINPGEVIKVPQPTPTQTPQPTATLRQGADVTPVPRATYVVQPGDQLQAIARNYGLTINDILQANGLSDADRIRSGQVLVIPLELVQLPGPTRTPTVPPPQPAPQLLSPADGAAFRSGDSVILQWASTVQLRTGEAYQVTVINVTADDGRPLRQIVTDTRLVVPPEFLPDGPAGFRWSVTTVRQRPNADPNQPPVYDSAGATSAERIFVWTGRAAP